MPPLPAITLPLPSNGPPPGYGWVDRDMSTMSSLTAFMTGLDGRDRFLGKNRCVVCGKRRTQHCHIIMASQGEVWADLKRRHWIPIQSKSHSANEPCNGLIMCLEHHTDFDQYRFFIRYDVTKGVFVFINYSGEEDLAMFHGKAIAIDIHDQHAPFPSIFIIHEMRVRGHHPFQPTQPDVPDEILWQDWLSEDNLLLVHPNPTNNFFRRDPQAPSDDDKNGDDDNGGSNGNGGGNGGADTDDTKKNRHNLPRRRGRSAGKLGTMAGTSSGTRKLELNAGVIADILAATHAMPSWKACQIENTSWKGTADENIQRYVSSIGVETSSPQLQLSDVTKRESSVKQ